VAKFEFDTQLEAALRDTSGKTIKFMRIVGLEGTYSTGGIEVNPGDMGFAEISFLQVQESVPTNFGGPGTPWDLFVRLTAHRMPEGENGRWLLFIHILGEDGKYSELPDGSPMALADTMQPTVMAIGA
jgi:hypothetical protein